MISVYMRYIKMESHVLNIKLNQSVLEPVYCTADLGLCVLLQQWNAGF